MTAFQCKGPECPSGKNNPVLYGLCRQYALQTNIGELGTNCALTAYLEDVGAYQQGVQEAERLAGVETTIYRQSPQ